VQRTRQSYRWEDLAARAELVDLVYRYAHGIDERDVAAVVACFATDGRYDIARATGDVGLNGREQIRQFLEEAFAGGPDRLLGEDVRSTHAMTNTLVEREDGEARLETQAVIYLARGKPDGGRGDVVVRGVRYSDQCVQIDGTWYIAHRRHQAAWEGTMAGGRAGR
jgi:3-phenylpropionate/cinnamic acid dioxygenase small subunit